MHPNSNTNRRQASFKAPPTSESISQQARREKALEEQKRKKSQQLDSLRNLDAFSSLSIDVEEEEEDDDPIIVREGVGRLSSLLPSAATSARHSQSPSPSPSSIPSLIPSTSPSTSTNIAESSKKLRKPNARFANKIMYAELLEMKDDELMLGEDHMGDDGDDGIPSDLQTNWVALGPVPKGKRCLAVSNQSSNVPGRVSNALLKSRLMGRTILSFPSPLPPLTIIDCILDENWKMNGILHVLDVILWKGQNIGECEANFRFWWRNTRLDELTYLDPVAPTKPKTDSPAEPDAQSQSSKQHIFAYPVTFLPVPYHLDLSYPSLLSTIIPSSRSMRQAHVKLPPRLNSDETEMEIDQIGQQQSSSEIRIESDGLLLYVSQASYEHGTSPLSTWVPVVSYSPGKPSPLSVFEKLIMRRMHTLKN